MHRSLEGKGTLGNQEGRVFEEQRRALEEWRTPCRANSRVKTSGVLLSQVYCLLCKSSINALLCLLYVLQALCKWSSLQNGFKKCPQLIRHEAY